MEAAAVSMKTYKLVGNALHMCHGHCTALDVGSGIDGWGAALLSLSLNARQRTIALFDPHVAAGRTGPADPTIRVVHDPVAEVPQAQWINYAYVFSHIPEAHVRATVERFRAAYPKAVATVLDYTLRGRDEEEAFFLLTQTDAENAECVAMGGRAFLDQHMRFTLDDIADILRHSGYGGIRTETLDSSGSRGFVLGLPSRD